MITAEQYTEALRLARGWSRAWVITHTRPDGDAIGAMVGVRHVLRQFVEDVTAVVFDPVLPRYEFLVADDPPTMWSESVKAQAARIDGVVVVDTCAAAQLEPIVEVLDGLDLPVVVFDHHQSQDLDASLKLIDVDASATSLMIAEWAMANDVNLDKAASVALFAGIAADTGWFRFSNADRRTYLVAARLIERGVRPVEIYHRLYCSDRPQRLALLGRMLNGLEFHDGGRCAIGQITREMIEACGAEPGDMEELATDIGRIGSVTCWALLTEMPDGRVRINLRSKGVVDMARVAETFGGGGHPRAAGARFQGTLQEAKAQVLSRILAHLL
ncbi:MAG: bifunctional oligoribonuclease/PAP phosphatase NrnA [Phycisphaerales bacterium]|nr:MAG: bifunctional oligoribonuclease/PAP phosphatase NrnA [Phycisphaerales bacterium]